MTAPWSYPRSEREQANAEHVYLEWHKSDEAVNLLDRLQMALDDDWSDITGELEGVRDEARDTFIDSLPEGYDEFIELTDAKALSVEDAIDVSFGFRKEAA